MDNDVALYNTAAIELDQDLVKARFLKELATFASLFFIGIVVVPIATYLVGNALFGSYGDGGFSVFYGALHADLRDGALPVWFLVLSPYIVWQILRLTIWGYRQASSAGTRSTN